MDLHDLLFHVTQFFIDNYSKTGMRLWYFINASERIVRPLIALPFTLTRARLIYNRNGFLECDSCSKWIDASFLRFSNDILFKRIWSNSTGRYRFTPPASSKLSSNFSPTRGVLLSPKYRSLRGFKWVIIIYAPTPLLLLTKARKF